MDHGPTTSPLTLPEAERRRRQGYYHQHCTLTEDVAWIWIWRRLTLETQDVGCLGNWRWYTLDIYPIPYHPCMLYLDLHLPYKSTIHVGKYTIHGCYGLVNMSECPLPHIPIPLPLGTHEMLLHKHSICECSCRLRKVSSWKFSDQDLFFLSDILDSLLFIGWTEPVPNHLVYFVCLVFFQMLETAWTLQIRWFGTQLDSLASVSTTTFVQSSLPSLPQ